MVSVFDVVASVLGAVDDGGVLLQISRQLPEVLLLHHADDLNVHAWGLERV